MSTYKLGGTRADMEGIAAAGVLNSNYNLHPQKYLSQRYSFSVQVNYFL